MKRRSNELSMKTIADRSFDMDNSTSEIKHDINDIFGYWWKGSLIKVIMNKRVFINKENIDDLIIHYKSVILPHKPLMTEIYQPVVDKLISLKERLGW